MKILNNGSRSFILSKEDVIAYPLQSPRGDLFKDHAKVTFDPKTVISLKDEAGLKLVKAYGKEEFVIIEDAKPVELPKKGDTVILPEGDEVVLESDAFGSDEAPVAKPVAKPVKNVGRPRKV